MRNLLKNTKSKELIEMALAALLVALGIIVAATTASRVILGFALVLAGMIIALQIFLKGKREMMEADKELEALKEKNRQMSLPFF